jgi:hypothetical protein
VTAKAFIPFDNIIHRPLRQGESTIALRLDRWQDIFIIMLTGSGLSA